MLVGLNSFSGMQKVYYLCLLGFVLFAEFVVAVLLSFFSSRLLSQCIFLGAIDAKLRRRGALFLLCFVWKQDVAI